MNRIVKRMAVPVGAAIILGSSGFAFMASSNVDASHAGSGVGVVGGYNVSDITYDTAANYGGDAYLVSVSFSLDNPAKLSNVGVYVDHDWSNQSARYTNCTNDNGSATSATRFTCTYTAGTKTPLVSGIEHLTITAAQ